MQKLWQVRIYDKTNYVPHFKHCKHGKWFYLGCMKLVVIFFEKNACMYVLAYLSMPYI